MDYDADGIDDVITGSIYEDVYLFRGLGDGKFAKAELLKDKDGKPLEGGYCCTTELLDMDSDGDLDLVCATRIGKVTWRENVGTRSSPKFDSEAQSLPMEKGVASIEGFNATYADWDGDGRRDLVVGSGRGHVVWHRNVGADDKPKFSSGRKLLSDSGFQEIREGDVPATHGGRAKVHLVDYDNDGLLDVLLGDFTSCTYNTRPPLTDEEMEEKAVLEKELKETGDKTYYAEVNRLNKLYWAAKKAGNPEEVKRIKAMQAEQRRPLDELYRKLRPFRTTGSKAHGWVWFYRQLPKSNRGLAVAVLSVEPASRTPEVTLRALASHTTVAPGQEFQVAISFQVADGWHIYGAEKGDSYLPTRIEWTLPAGTTLKNVQWPEPLAIENGDDVQPTYEGTAIVLATILVSRDAGPDAKLKLAADVSWQVCTESICKSGRAKIKTGVVVAKSVRRESPSTATE